MPAGLHLLVLVDWCYSSHITCPIGLAVLLLVFEVSTASVYYFIPAVLSSNPVTSPFSFQFFHYFYIMSAAFVLSLIIEDLTVSILIISSIDLSIPDVCDTRSLCWVIIRKGFSTISEIIKPFSDFSVFCWCNFRSILRFKSTRNKFIGK